LMQRMLLRQHYKSMKRYVLLSQGSVRTLVRRGGQFVHTWVKNFFLFTSVQTL